MTCCPPRPLNVRFSRVAGTSFRPIYVEGVLQSATAPLDLKSGLSVSFNITTGRLEITAAGGSGGSIDWKDSVKAATDVALPASTRVDNVRTANAAGAFPTVDGVSVGVSESILDKINATGADRGIWTLTDAGSGGTPWVLTRRNDADTSAEVTAGLHVPVVAGTLSGGKTYRLDTADPIALNTTSLSFSVAAGAGDVVGPGSATDGRIALFDGTTGKLIKVSSETPASILAAAIAVDPVAGGAPVDVTKAAASAGAAGTWSRSDHKHDVSTAAAGTVTFGAAAEGTATSLARSDHAHALTAPSAPADVTKAAAAAGSSANVARQDHKHDVSTAVVGALTLSGVSAAEGTATSLSRSDHAHSITGILPAANGGDSVSPVIGANGTNANTTYNISDGNYFTVPASTITGGTKDYTWAYSGTPEEGEIATFDVHSQTSDLRFIDSTIGTGAPITTVVGGTKRKVRIQYNGANWVLASRARFA